MCKKLYLFIFFFAFFRSFSPCYINSRSLNVSVCLATEKNKKKKKKKHYHEFKHICKTFYNFPPAHWHWRHFSFIHSPCSVSIRFVFFLLFLLFYFFLFLSYYYCQFFSRSIFRLVYLCGSCFYLAILMILLYFFCCMCVIISNRQIWK